MSTLADELESAIDRVWAAHDYRGLADVVMPNAKVILAALRSTDALAVPSAWIVEAQNADGRSAKIIDTSHDGAAQRATYCCGHDAELKWTPLYAAQAPKTVEIPTPWDYLAQGTRSKP